MNAKLKSPTEIINHFITEKHKGMKVKLTAISLATILLHSDKGIKSIPKNTAINIKKATRSKVLLTSGSYFVWIPVTSNRIRLSIG